MAGIDNFHIARLSPFLSLKKSTTNTGGRKAAFLFAATADAIQRFSG
ncbi:hypothetical protein AGR4A_Cc40147 [Agrobacterium tumefaciens str. B6]|jgi:hypothetical protein|uniref:Uncharacterized protein n=1 Tax=Agrobacterium tumefaciens str. B6 TaxID=1183423 RepID=A0A822V326_AGRTU|nr:hypothetical protein AGR4A_Cc40147 [Agrobacterium tumefaciens str. B6]